MRGLLVLVGLVLAISPAAHAARGDLRYFKTLPELRTDGRPASLAAAAVQPDGKVVVAGTAQQQTGSDWVVARVDPADGSLDPGFGQGGVVRIPVDVQANGIDSARAVTVAPGGRIYVAGDAQNAGFQMAVVALEEDGAPAGGFGPGGLRTVDFDGAVERANAVIADAGTVTIGGTAGIGGPGPDGFGLARFDTSGQPAPGFGLGGKVVTTFPGGGGEAMDLVPLGDGRIVAVGTADAPSFKSDVAAAVYDASGTATASRTYAQPGIESAVDGELAPEGVVFGVTQRSDSLELSTNVSVIDPATLDPVAGLGGEPFARPSVFGGLAPAPGGGLAALGTGPFGGSLDDYQLAFLGADARPSEPIRNQPSTADRNDIASAIVHVPAIGSRRDSAPLLVGAGTSNSANNDDVPAISANGDGGPSTAPPQGTDVGIEWLAPGRYFRDADGTDPVYENLVVAFVPVPLPPGKTGFFPELVNWYAEDQYKAAVMVVNHGPVAARYTLTFAPPAHEDGYTDSVSPTGEIPDATDLVEAPRPLAAGGRRLHLFTGTFDAGGPATLAAALTAINPADSNAANDTASIEVAVQSRTRYSKVTFSAADKGGLFKGLSREAGSLKSATAAALGRVDLAVLRRKGGRCRWLSGKRGKLARKPCARPVFLRAKGKAKWRFRVRRTPPRGTYDVFVRPRAAAKELQFSKALGNRFSVRVR